MWRSRGHKCQIRPVVKQQGFDCGLSDVTSLRPAHPSPRAEDQPKSVHRCLNCFSLGFPLASPCSGIVHHLSGRNRHTLTQIPQVVQISRLGCDTTAAPSYTSGHCMHLQPPQETGTQADMLSGRPQEPHLPAVFFIDAQAERSTVGSCA